MLLFGNKDNFQTYIREQGKAVGVTMLHEGIEESGRVGEDVP